MGVLEDLLSVQFNLHIGTTYVEQKMSTFASFPILFKLNIVEAFKLTKFRKRSKLDLATIDFENLEVCDVKYLSPSFDNDICLCFPLCRWEFQVHMVDPWIT